MNFKKIALGILIIILITVAAVMIFLQQKFSASIPERTGTITIPSLNAPVQITFDKMAVPQIWARTAEDAWFSVGWLHAADRLFQMDMLRRVSQGRLAEFFGAPVLDIDRLQRKIGHRLLAEQALSGLDEQSRSYLEAYVRGINQYVAHKNNLPPEYTVLNIGFEEWTILDCIALFSFQTWFSDALQSNDEYFNQVVDAAGFEKTSQILPDNPAWIPTTVPDGKRHWYSDLNIRESVARELFRDGVKPFLMSLGSNCWVVAPERSKSGRAMMASDPHLEVSRLPQFWYIIGVHSFEENLDVVGITTPGIPVVVYGHNGQVSWAFTAAGVDLADYYTEYVNPENPGQYEGPEGWLRFEQRTEVIKIKGQDTAENLQVNISRHGPIVSSNDSLNQAYAFHWAGFDRSLSEAVRNGFRMPQISDFQTFREIVTGLGALNANWMYADRTGNIGYQLGAPVPIRQSAQSILHLPGNTESNDWLGYQPLANTPYAYNPQHGWLATCNNPPARENLGYSLPGNFAGDRILRIEKLLETAERYSVDDMKKFQQDQYSEFMLRWKIIVSRLLERMAENEWVDIVNQWQGGFHAGSRAGALVEKWLYYLRENTFRDELGELTDRAHLRVMFRDRIMFEIYSSGDNVWFDDIRTANKIESREEIAVKSMRSAIEDVGDQTWGDLQSLTMAHPMGEVPILTQLLGLKKGPFVRGGNPGTLNVSTLMPTEDGLFQTIGGPSWRFVIDLAAVDNMEMVIPAGQSGNPMDEHFFDFYDLWSEGKYWNVPFTRSAVDKKMVSMLELIPANLP